MTEQPGGGYPFAEFGAGSRVAEPVLRVINAPSIAVGTGVDIRSHVLLEAIARAGDVVLRIGDGTYLGHFVRITALGGVSIGRKVLIADRVYISDTSHVYEDTETPIIDQPLRLGRRVEIADGAWLGIGSAIIGNVRVGQNAVVGANTVVRSDVPDFSVVAGDPARVVRRFHEGEWQRAGDPPH